MRRVTTCFVALALTTLAVPAFAASANAPTKDILEHKTIDAKLTNVTLADCIDYLRDVSGANIHVNWRALETANITKDTLVNVRLRSISLHKVLDVVLSEAGEGDMLTYYIDEGVIEITTRQLADAKLYTRVYPVEDLVTEVPDFTDAPNFNLQSNTQTSGRGGGGSSGGGGGGGGGGGQSQGLFGGGGGAGGGMGGASDKSLSRAEQGDQLVKLIMEIIRPDVWRENGGTASIRYFQGKLIVTAPRSVHEAIGGPFD